MLLPTSKSSQLATFSFSQSMVLASEAFVYSVSIRIFQLCSGNVTAPTHLEEKSTNLYLILAQILRKMSFATLKNVK